MAKFIATNELGRLAKWLRILGYDTVLSKEKGGKLVVQSLREERVILTRDSKMGRFSGTRMLHVRSDFVEEQLAEVINKLSLEIDKGKLFTMCVLCDKELTKAAKPEVKGRVPEYVYNTQELFMECPNCKKIYWQGSHWDLVEKFLSKLKN
ncbi:MAG: hypothetical protein COS99_05400 [Candidatus Omnitrophica bacterium CG07_land_8_20_14_0_80_42_15]|uniref:Mut7-C RNAse domain-containing protein n=1 Tax=Candidatus Aquitaenariimonas noxiae TaxID=1974741 RepID=A0A2J0L2G3_9BACT|nr:MAG: hypothetical protein COS99_05400 [Candidatus Omnitrophica bacterium CG07_land_8_20_14_0_80_42_15]